MSPGNSSDIPPSASGPYFCLLPRKADTSGGVATWLKAAQAIAERRSNRAGRVMSVPDLLCGPLQEVVAGALRLRGARRA